MMNWNCTVFPKINEENANKTSKCIANKHNVLIRFCIISVSTTGKKETLNS